LLLRWDTSKKSLGVDESCVDIDVKTFLSGTSMVRPGDHLRFSYDKDYLIDVHADHVHDD